MKAVLGMAAMALLSAWIPSDSGTVDQRVREWQPTARERRWEQIGWAKDLLTAERLAKTSRRPVFLFTHDGRLNVGRC
jgi:hypothetical protein